MAWIYLAESEDSVWPYHHGSSRSPIVRETDSLKLFYCLGCESVKLLPPQYGTTFPLSYRNCCPDRKLISSTADFPARISALSELEKAWKEAEADYFFTLSGSLAFFDQDSFSWKTAQLSLFGGLTEFCWSSLRWGSIVGGQLFQPQKWAQRTYERDGGYLPTPTASSAGTNGKQWDEIERAWVNGIPSLSMMASGGSLPGHPAGSLNPQWVEQAMGYRIDHTALEDWATQWFRPARAKRSKDYRELSDAAGIAASETPHTQGNT